MNKELPEHKRKMIDQLRSMKFSYADKVIKMIQDKVMLNEVYDKVNNWIDLYPQHIVNLYEMRSIILGLRSNK